jgi:hypothetical protein
VCVRRHWRVAAHEVRDRTAHLLRNLPYEFAEMNEALATCQSRHQPTARDVRDDLEQLQDEFGGYTFDPQKRLLSVRTDAIELEGIDLGPFAIQLRLGELVQLPRHSVYNVVALEPHPASVNDTVTHPHVSDEHLCEGEAMAGIRAALEEGRLADFFLLVKSVLETYNPDSPYVSLDKWNGISCHDCGTTVSDDERCTCNRCDHDFCDECTSSCHACEATFCNACLSECPDCGHNFGSECLSKCDGCGKRYCDDCLEDGVCEACRQHPIEETQADDPEPDPTDPAGADAPAPAPAPGFSTPAPGILAPVAAPGVPACPGPGELPAGAGASAAA